MVDFDWNTKMVTPELHHNTSKKLYEGKPSVQAPPYLGDLPPVSPSVTSAYEHYLRLPELSKLWQSRHFPQWKIESLLRPALQGLEITFRFVSLVLSDPRPYINCTEWLCRLESLSLHQLEIIAAICEEDDEGTVPVIDPSQSDGVMARNRRSYSEVWNPPGAGPVVSLTSQASLLPRLAAWRRSEAFASKVGLAIECLMLGSKFMLGLGEPNLAGKPTLEYDLICNPTQLHALKSSPLDVGNPDNQTLFTAHQILECWVFMGRELVGRIQERIRRREYDRSAKDCWLLERVWKLMSEIEELHTLMDTGDFLRLKRQLAIGSYSESEAFCFRSKGLVELTRLSKDLRHMVPDILGVEVDPSGGPRVQDAAMGLFHERWDPARVHLLQAMQAVEVAAKRFFFSYREMVAVVMGSLEVGSGRIRYGGGCGQWDRLSQAFMDPPYFPSVDAAKTFLGSMYSREDKHSFDNERKEY